VFDPAHEARTADHLALLGDLHHCATRNELVLHYQPKVDLSIDDFGTGYSSLAYLQRLPVDELKIDRSFVMNLAAVNDDAIIVRSTIELAHNLGLTVVAEGVEGEQAAAMLLAYGCDGVQGYHFGRPSAGEELAALLANPVAPIARTARKSSKRAERRARPGALELQ
jgi:sensor c-di-GMP phosphodiesterase-like protein